MRSGRPLTRRRWVRRVVLVLLLAVGLEGGLRLGLGLGHPPLLQTDPEIGYLFQPDQRLRRFGNRVRVNQFHQRSEPVEPLPPAGTLRVLCVGDSVTWGGVQVDQADTYPEQLAARLRTADGPAVEVLNASAGSWGLGNELAYLRRFGTFGSRVVVLQIGSHDLTQPPSTGEVVGVSPDHPDRRPWTATGELFGRYVRPRLTRLLPASPPPAAPSPAVPTDDAAEAERNLHRLREAVAVCQRSSARVVVLHTPNRDEVVPAGGKPTDQFAAHRGRFLAVCRELDLPVIDLSVAWADDPRAADYFRDPVHLTAAGNRAVSDALAPLVR